jgi:streptomycin 3"-adenylyltransferase
MVDINKVLNTIKERYYEILKNNLVGIYLHGSLAMDCFNENFSDIDFLVVVKENMPFEQKGKLVDVLLDLSQAGPYKGFEMSVLLEKEVQNFRYPTPFLLHYSDFHKKRYLEIPEYICGGFEDPDLAAHIVITRARGKSIFGKPINQVFSPVPREYYLDSITSDVKDAKEHIIESPVSCVLNLCRVLAFIRSGLVCSKKEGGKWAVDNLPHRYKYTVDLALKNYEDSCAVFDYNSTELLDFAHYMLSKILKL